MKPLVSIIIPTYNRASFLGETLDCILSQTYCNWECIVVDDGSQDHTKELIDFYSERDSRIRYIQRSPDHAPGANSCRNVGLCHSKGQYIQWLDSDDLISAEKIESQIALLQDSVFDIAFCRWGRFQNRINEPQLLDLKTYKDYNSSQLFLDELGNDIGYFPIHAYLISKKIIIKAGPWLEGLKVNQDGEFIIRVIANSKNIKFSGKGYALYRRSSHGNTSQYNKEKLNDLINSWKIIEGYLYIRYKKNDLSIIKNAKKSIFSVCKIWPEVIEENRDFFYGVKTNDTKGKIKKMIKRYLFKLRTFKL